ncbi:hypothetical protein H8959_008280 [Pygathrix nigripes]
MGFVPPVLAGASVATRRLGVPRTTPPHCSPELSSPCRGAKEHPWEAVSVSKKGMAGRGQGRVNRTPVRGGHDSQLSEEQALKKQKEMLRPGVHCPSSEGQTQEEAVQKDGTAGPVPSRPGGSIGHSVVSAYRRVGSASPRRGGGGLWGLHRTRFVFSNLFPRLMWDTVTHLRGVLLLHDSAENLRLSPAFPKAGASPGRERGLGSQRRFLAQDLAPGL